MPEHLFTTSAPQISFSLPAPPEDASALSLAFEMDPPAGFSPGAQIRLCHVKLAGVKGLPKKSQIFELKVSGNGQLVCELSGFGNKRPEFVEPLKLGEPTGSYGAVYDPYEGVVDIETSTNTGSGTAHIKSGPRPVEVLFGFALVGKKLSPPIGWTLRWEGDSPAVWE
jgi:hypothetical protein